MQLYAGSRPITAVYRGDTLIWPHRIAVQSGSGYAGSVLASTIAGQWYGDDVPIAGVVGHTLTVTPEMEGQALRCGPSNVIQLWTPRLYQNRIRYWLDALDYTSLTFDATLRYVLRIQSKVGAGYVYQDIVSAAPTYLGNDGELTRLSSYFGTSMAFDDPARIPTEEIRIDTMAYASGANRSQTQPLVDFGDFGLFRSVSSDDPSLHARIAGGSNGIIHPDAWDGSQGIISATMTPEQSTLDMARAPKVTRSGRLDSAVYNPRLFYNDSKTWVGALSELIIWDHACEDVPDMNQRVQGYLAHRWGRVDLLADAHPYKTEAPRVQ